jgi:hypothetical protein
MLTPLERLDRLVPDALLVDDYLLSPNTFAKRQFYKGGDSPRNNPYHF